MGYIEVTEETLDRVAEFTELPRSFWEREMLRINQFDKTLVVFIHNGEKVHIVIDRSFNVPFVMKAKFGLEPDSLDKEL